MTDAKETATGTEVRIEYCVRAGCCPRPRRPRTSCCPPTALGEKTVRATDAGHRQLLRWALRSWSDAELMFAVEDCRHVSTRLERALLAAGQTVVRVPPKLMARGPLVGAYAR